MADYGPQSGCSLIKRFFNLWGSFIFFWSASKTEDVYWAQPGRAQTSPLPEMFVVNLQKQSVHLTAPVTVDRMLVVSHDTCLR